MDNKKNGVNDAVKLLNTNIKNAYLLAKDQLGWQLFRYLCTGGSAAITDWSIFWFLINLWHMHYILSGAISFAIATLLNYIMSANWVFKGKRKFKLSKEISLIFFISAIGLVINQLCLLFMIESLNLYYMWAKVIATGIVFFWNYFMRKYYVFAQ